jgi:ATP-binding cassette, subfamily B, bacterial
MAVATSVRQGTFRLYWRALREVREFYPAVALALLLGLLRMPLTLLAPVPLQVVVDHVIGRRPFPPWLVSLPVFHDIQPTALLAASVGVFAVVIFANFFHVALEWGLRQAVGQRITNHFRSRLLRHVFLLSLAHLESDGMGEAIYAIEQNGTALQNVIAENLILLVTAFVTFAGMLAVLALLSLKICLVAALVSPLIAAVLSLSAGYLRQCWQNMHASERRVLSLVREVLGALRVVKLFGNEQREHAGFCAFAGDILDRQRKTLFTEGIVKALIGIVLAASSAMMFLMAAGDVMAGRMTVGQMTLVMAYASMLYGPLHLLATRILEQQEALARLEKAFSILDQPGTIPEAPHPIPIRRAVGSIAFRKVDFHYPSGGAVLNGVDFEVAAGSRVGIRGPSGGGKTTLASLMLRLYDPTSGCVLVDGVDIRHYRAKEFRAQFAVVPQQAALFERSVAENIDYGCGASRTEIIRAARLAEADAFIRTLPAGYDTLIGEGGLRLSGGERQRIALARMFVRDAPFLVLDEPTGALDAETARSVLRSLELFSRGCTLFIISHDPGALLNCDCVLEVEAGRVRVCKPTDFAHLHVQGA